jgi:hypothetical protein
MNRSPIFIGRGNFRQFEKNAPQDFVYVTSFNDMKNGQDQYLQLAPVHRTYTHANRMFYICI